MNARQRRIDATVIRPVLSVTIGVLLLATGHLLRGQQTSTFNGTLPTGAIPAGAGGLDQYSSFSGALNPTMPLYHVGGRGEVGFDLVWHFQQTWLAAKRYGGSTPFIPIDPYPNANLVGSQGVAGPLGAGAVFSRTGSHFASCPNNGGGTTIDSTLARIVFEAPDGSQTELVDHNTNGAVYTIPNACTQSPGSVDAGRGTDFRSTDGGSIQFLSDSPILDYTSYGFGEDDRKVTGSLRFSNGVTYRIVNSVVQWMRDRHGNQIQFQYASGQSIAVTWYLSVDAPSQIIDPLGRTISLNYNDSACGGCTTVTYPGYGGATRVIQIVQAHLSTGLLRGGGSVQTLDQLFPGTNQSLPSSNFDPVLPSYIQYADGRRFTFQYNSYGELARVNLPTGGAVEYDYGDGHNGSGSGFEGSASDNNAVLIYRRLQERREYAAGGSAVTSRTHYTVSYPGGTGTTDTAVTYDGAGNPQAQTITTMAGSPLDALQMTGTSCNTWNEGLPTKVETGSPSSLITVANTYAPQSGCVSNPQLTVRTTTLNDTNAVSETDFSYDAYNNVVQQDDYDWGGGTRGALLRTTKNTYVTDPNYTQNYYLLRLPNDTTVIDGPSQKAVAYTLYRYDEQDAHHQLHDAPNIINHDGNYGTSFNTRGNLTTIWRSSSGGTNVDVLSAQYDYDIAGNLITQRDGNQATGRNGNQTITQHSYSDNYSDGQNRYSYARRTSTTNALGETSAFQYDFNSGQVVTAQDANQVQTTYQYNDPLDRITAVQQAVGTPQQTSRTYQYPSVTQVTEYDSQTAGANLRTDSWFDGLGRARETDTYEDGTHYIAVSTGYDAAGRVSATSNPYHAGDTIAWTGYQYDTLGRIHTVTSPDGDVRTTSYSGHTTTVTDEAGKQKQYSHDGLGRLVDVFEDTAPGGLNYGTGYSYDALDNLIAVSQGYCPQCQQRTFAYDGLSRLISAGNPESGTVRYTGYDNVGNLLSKTDARNVTTTYGYDVLNRISSQSYSDGVTPAVSYSYGQSGNGLAYSLDHLISVSSSASITAYTAFDPLGRTLASTQTTNGQTFHFAYTYNLAGALTSETYPSGRVVTTSYDGANRVTAVTGTLQGVNTPYLSLVDYYWPHGAMHKSKYGNQLVHTNWSFTGQLQPVLFWDAFQDDGNQFVFLEHPISWNTPGKSDNNGTIRSITYYQGGPGPMQQLTSYTQTFSYDGVNRLTGAGASGNPWSRTFGYDQYGNMWITGSTGVTPAGNAPTSNVFNNANQIAGASYDASGNQTLVNGNTLLYNAEAHVSTVTAPAATGGASESLVYDGLGQRVEKLNTGGTTVYVYDAFGRLAAEYASAPSAAPCRTCYLTYDHLGSVRVVTDQNGNVIAQHDFLPFGEEVPAGTPGYSAAFGASDGVSQRFTGQERDTETGLDFFQARYYGAALGRFTSPDPGNAGADLYNPQSWNGYSYVANNPLVFVDPSGQSFFSIFKKVLGFVAVAAGVLSGFGVPFAGEIAMVAGLASGGSNLNGIITNHSVSAPVAAPMSEQIPSSPSIYNPGQFENDYNSYEHYRMTRAAGGSFSFALGVVGVDFWHGSQDTDQLHANWHAMGGGQGERDAVGAYSDGHQSCREAYAGTVSQLRAATAQALTGDMSAAELAVHTIQDSYAGGHQYQLWPGGLPSWSHERADASFSPNPVAATRRYLQALRGAAPMQSPESYLYPRPASCR